MINTSGFFIKRELLSHALDIATIAAVPDSALGQALVQTHSVGRFLRTIAEISVNMVRAKKEKGRSPKTRAVAALDIWDVKVKDDERA